MESSLSILANDLFLRQSELFGDEYKNSEINQTNTFNDLSISNLEDWYNSILNKYTFLNDFQITNFQLFLNSLNYILSTIDPKKLEINFNSIDEENALLLWRESNQGISKLFFDKYGQIVYMFNGNNGRKIKGTFENNIDMERLLYRFISM